MAYGSIKKLATLICIVGMGLLLFTTAHANNNLTVKAGRVTLNAPIPSAGDGFVTVNLAQSYTNPVIFVLPTNEGSDPASVRLRNVTNNSFEVGVVEPDGSNGFNPGMTVDYIVAEEGVYTLPDGTLMEVGTLSTNSFQSNQLAGTSWENPSFAQNYGTSPVVIADVQTTNNEPAISARVPSTPWLEVAIRNITATDMEIALERAEVSSGGAVLAAETIGYLVMQAGVNSNFTANGGAVVNYESIRTADNVTSTCTAAAFSAAHFAATPLLAANEATRDGGDGGWVRRCTKSATQTTMRVDEDVFNDTDRAHTTERLSILALSQAFTAAATSPVGVQMEAGQIVVPGVSAGLANFTDVSFGAKSFLNPPLVFALPSNEGTAPAAIRIRDITTAGFKMAAVEPSGDAGAHPVMTVNYVAVIPGEHRLPDGTIFEAGSLSTALYQAGTGGSTGYATINFNSSFAVVPAVVYQVQSVNSEPGIDPGAPSIPWLTAVTNSISTTAMSIALERAEAISGTIVAEEIGYLAVESATQGNFLDDNGDTVLYESIRSGSVIDGWDNGCDAISYVNSYAASPISLASPATRNGGNGGWTRQCVGIGESSASQISLTHDEDRANDSERGHIDEEVSILAFSQAFDLCLAPRLNVTKTVTTALSDPINGTANPKAIPGSVVQYSVSTFNDRSGSADPDSIAISDQLPAGVELFVGDLDGSGSPLIVDEGTGTTTSGLTYTFTALNSLTDSVEFSNDNAATWTYTPVADANGYDSAVTDLRIMPTGILEGADDTDIPTLVFTYQVRVR